MRKLLVFLVASVAAISSKAQIGEHRNVVSLGVNGGVALSNVSFVNEVKQGMHSGMTGGVTLKYTCEKYFKTICSLVAEVNYANIGWKENILDKNDEQVVTSDGAALSYVRNMHYIQIPLFANLAWGKEEKGLQFFFQIGPQLGYCIGESYSSNFVSGDLGSGNMTIDRYSNRVSQTVAQDTMAVEKRFDYGIAGGVGVQLSLPHVGRFLIEGRYYYGLGNIYGDTQRDAFKRSNFGNIVIKMTYLFDLINKKKSI